MWKGRKGIWKGREEGKRKGEVSREEREERQEKKGGKGREQRGGWEELGNVEVIVEGEEIVVKRGEGWKGMSKLDMGRKVL